MYNILFMLNIECISVIIYIEVIAYICNLCLILNVFLI